MSGKFKSTQDRQKQLMIFLKAAGENMENTLNQCRLMLRNRNSDNVSQNDICHVPGLDDKKIKSENGNCGRSYELSDGNGAPMAPCASN